MTLIGNGFDHAGMGRKKRNIKRQRFNFSMRINKDYMNGVKKIYK